MDAHEAFVTMTGQARGAVQFGTVLLDATDLAGKMVTVEWLHAPGCAMQEAPPDAAGLRSGFPVDGPACTCGQGV